MKLVGLESIFEWLRGNVLPAGGDDEFLDPIGDVEKAVFVDVAHVAAVQPAFRVDGLGRGLGLLPVFAHEDSAA